MHRCSFALLSHVQRASYGDGQAYASSENSRQIICVPLTHTIQLLKCLVQGINALVKLLQLSKDFTAELHLAETVAVAITILSINNELNQDAVRSFSSHVIWG